MLKADRILRAANSRKLRKAVLMLQEKRPRREIMAETGVQGTALRQLAIDHGLEVVGRPVRPKRERDAQPDASE